jgi:hypothetical protein
MKGNAARMQPVRNPVSGNSAARIRSPTERHAGRREWNGGYLDWPGGQVKPLLVAVAQSDEPNPVKDRVFVATNFEHNRGGSAVHEVETALGAVALDVESADAMTGETGHVVLAALKRHADHFDHLFVRAGQVLSQAKEALTVLAKGVQADGNRATVRPKKLIAFVANSVILTILGRIAAEEYLQSS